ncbi:testicular acid phosphatase homolog [Nasonia vitripennis]|uniref:Uncharacterized protein n=1 Tax=Nasonia vitripennis TaxID=7425 RepID=A0A7M7IV51_NASVI|nr:testicular acid phosphatase homolog [Nasonia vitripennis]
MFARVITSIAILFIVIRSQACSTKLFRYIKLLEKAGKLPEVIKKFEEHRDFFDSVRDETQITSEQVGSVFLIPTNLQSVLSLGLPFPDWCSEEDYKKLQVIQALFYDLMAQTESMRKIATGPVIERFLENVRNSEKLKNRKKLYLYSAHNINVALFNRAHNFAGIPKNPAYGSAVIFEKLRGPDDRIYLRMFYWTCVSEKLIVLKLDGCDEYECLLSNYVDIISPILPEVGFAKCKTSAYDSYRINLTMLYLFAEEDLFSFK